VTVPSYAAPGYPPPAPKTRPAVVTVASYLLYLVAVFEVINAILVFATLNTVKDAVNDLYANTSLSNDGGTVIAVAYSIGAGINVLFAVGFLILGLFNGRGKNGARITTWVVGGISLCCVGAGLGSSALTGSLRDGANRTGPTQSQIQSRLADALPSWYTPVTTTITVLTLVAILTVIILLALPASSDFFRKPAPGWEGAVAYPGYPVPGQPGYPPQQAQQPGYPPQQPGYPAQQPGYPPQQPGYPPQQPGYPAYGQPNPYGPQGQPGQPAPGLPAYPGQPVSGSPVSGQPAEPPTTQLPPGQLPSYPGSADPTTSLAPGQDPSSEPTTYLAPGGEPTTQLSPGSADPTTNLSPGETPPDPERRPNDPA